MLDGKDLIKFDEKCLLKISKFIEYVDDQYFININNRKYKILMEN